MADNEIKESEETSVPSPHSHAQVVPKPGARLAEYREKAGMTVEQVASRLKMTNRQVQQIEADNYESMYSMAIARGFIRAYAKLLNVDGEPLAAMLPLDKPEVSLPIQPKRSVQESFVGNRRPFRSGRAFPGKLIGMLIVTLIVVVGALMAWRAGWAPSFSRTPVAKDSISPDLQPRKSVAKEVPQKEKATATGSVSTELAAPKTTVITEDALKPTSPSDSGPSASPSQSEPVSSAKSENASPVASKSKGTLVFRAREKSWIQVVRANSSADNPSVLFERTLMPGQTESVEVDEPVSLTVGNARSVEATFRGQPLELKTTEYSTVARLKLK